ncbi:hypothetical protein [Streptomyces sp. HUAS TT7]|uniref:hypothetical protein n=1 Tax=Streptomyces sp. HUAS TT7 TaxID=3447507 RepID=UPI003F65EE88
MRRAEAHRTLRAFLAAVYPERRVRAAAGEPGAWLNEYPPNTGEDAEMLGGYLPHRGMDMDRPVAVHLALKQWRRKGRPHLFRFPTFDLDAKIVGPVQAAADAALLSEALRAEGIGPVPVASGSPGGIHLWTGCAELVDPSVVYRINDAAQRLCPSLDGSPLGNAKEGLVRPPGAAHRNGGYSALTAHTVGEAIRLLGPDSAPAAAFERLAVRLETMAAALPAVEEVAADEGDDQGGAVEDSSHGVSEPGPVRTPPRATGHGGRKVPPSIVARGQRVRSVVEDADGCPRLDMPWRPLGEKAVRGLRRQLGRRDDHSDMKHAPARSMALAGWTQAEALAVVRDAESSPALEWLRSERRADGTRRPRSKEETERLWARVWWLAVEDAARMPHRPEDDGHQDEPDDVRRSLADLFARMQAAGTARWLRESGPADAAVLLALAWLMQLAGTLDVSAAVRRVGVLAGYTPQTASQALWRLQRDGWIVFTAEAERRAGRARRVTLAASHECPDHHRHRCAIYTPTDDVSPVHPGSDRSGTPRPPRPPYASLGSLRAVLTHQQAGVWHHLGHHCARTFWALKTLHRPRLADLMAATGYSRRTTVRHLHRLQALQLVTPGLARRGEPTYAVTGRSLYEAAQETGTADRTAQLATTARIDQAVHEWWSAEEAHRSLPYKERPERPGPDQLVFPGMDPRGRAYPRDVEGRPDHLRARLIEAQRIGAIGILMHAQELAATGQLIDPVHLSPTGATPARPGRRRTTVQARTDARHTGE